LPALQDLLVVGAVQLRLLFPGHVEIGFADDLIRRGQAGIIRKGLIASQVNQVAILPKHCLRDVVHDQREQRRCALHDRICYSVPTIFQFIGCGHLLPPAALT
jgi:hypothetical protein